ncbi:MAG: GDP-mannose 4,6-dehydratase, partial [Candidatus Promineifilaceae bacterium]
MNNSFAGVYNGQTVLVTGHTGFKGSWLTTWLLELGANVVGFSLEEAPTVPSNFALSNLADRIIDIRGDIRDYAAFKKALADYQPQVVFHLAAQPIVLHSIAKPK